MELSDAWARDLLCQHLIGPPAPLEAWIEVTRAARSPGAKRVFVDSVPCEDVPGAAHRESPPSVGPQEDPPLGGAQGLRPWAPRVPARGVAPVVTSAPRLARGPGEVSERSGELRGVELARGPGEVSERSGELRGVEPVRGLQTASKGEPGIRAGLGQAIISVEPLEGLAQADANRLAAAAGLAGEARGMASDLVVALWELTVAEDLLAIRYGPCRLAVALDDAAAFRHPDWARFGFAVDSAGGPYMAKAEAVAAIDEGEPLPVLDWASLPALDELVIRAYATAHAAG